MASKKVISIEAGVWWTKVALVEYRKKNPPVYQAFAFPTPEHAVEDGYIRDKDSLASALKTELARRSIREKDVVFTLSSSKVVTREVVIPFVKDNKIRGIVDAQIRDYFPMDVSNYTISYSKMDVFEEDGKKQLKLLLVAIPDNLLNNYVTFATLAGLHVETFDYLGNGTVQLMCDSFLQNAVVVQLEEQSTIISILENKRLAFQRVTPYGYGQTLTSVVEHPILGVKDEYAAFDFLLSHNVVYNRPSIQPMADETERERRQKLADEAYDDLAESLRYHLRIAHTAIEYYQNQKKEEFTGNLYLVGEGSRFSGIHKLFSQEMPLPLQEIDFAALIDLKRETPKVEDSGTVSSQEGAAPVNNKPRAATPVGFLSVIGAAVHPIDAKPKDLVEAASKKNSLRTSYIILAGATLVSLGLILGSSIRHLVAITQHNKLQKRIQDLSYVQDTYDEQALIQQEEGVYEGLHNQTRTKNEQLLPLITQLEENLPSEIHVESMQANNDSVTLNMVSDTKITAGQMLLNFQDVTLLTNVSIPAMQEDEDDAGNTQWNYSVNAVYSELPPEDLLNMQLPGDSLETEGMENNTDNVDADQTAEGEGEADE